MSAMALGDWISKGAKRVQELGSEYKQHHALVERLLALDQAAAQDELTRAWLSMDERARAGFKMTLAGLSLGQQTASASPAAKTRGERLKTLQALLGTLDTSPPAPSTATGSREATITSSAARVTQKLAGAAERARPRAEQIFEQARKELREHGPAIEATVKSVISDILKMEMPGAASPGSAPRNPESAATPPPIPTDQPADAARAAARPASTACGAIAGHWVGTLRRPGTTDTIGCNLHVAANGHPVWTYHDANGFQQVELTHTGQKLQYVPPERGVVTVVVQSVTGSVTESGYIVDFSFERANHGYMTQRYQRIVLAGTLRGAQLQVTYSESGLSSFGDRTGLTATEEVKEYSGSLTRQA